MDSEFVLASFFRYVVRRGFPLTIRDYQDVLRALQKGYGRYRRQDLLWLCETLWARTEEEVRWLNLLFRELPQSTRDQNTQWTGDREEPFILDARPLISPRVLTLIWKRFRLPLRVGPGVELDIQQTIVEQCRHGVLVAPALIPARQNQARLIVLVDASPSMLLWQSFTPILTTSLRDSRLESAPVYYFSNIPREVLYENDTLTQPVPLEKVMYQHQSRPLLIISDGGAARGVLSSWRIAETAQFFTQVRACWRPIAWVNPMPKYRWTGSSAEQIGRSAHVAMSEMTEDGFVHAIDVLRGQKSGVEDYETHPCRDEPF